MRLFILTCFLVFNSLSWGQLYNRLIKLNVGVTSEQIDLKNQIAYINDTSAIQFDFVSKSPAISYSHEFIFGNILSITGKAGFQYFNIYYNNTYFGSPYAYISAGPQFSLFSRKHFEYYMKFQVGVNYWFNNADALSPDIKRMIPNEPSIFTGVTIGGFNYYLTDSFGLNLELSIWQPELLTFGLTYRFYHGEKPSIQELQGI